MVILEISFIYSQAQNYISQLNYKMKEANVALCLLHDSYEKSIAEKEKLQIEKGEIEVKMKAADELVDVLNPRHTRYLTLILF